MNKLELIEENVKLKIELEMLNLKIVQLESQLEECSHGRNT